MILFYGPQSHISTLYHEFNFFFSSLFLSLSHTLSFSLSLTLSFSLIHTLSFYICYVQWGPHDCPEHHFLVIHTTASKFFVYVFKSIADIEKGEEWKSSLHSLKLEHVSSVKGWLFCRPSHTVKVAPQIWREFLFLILFS